MIFLPLVVVIGQAPLTSRGDNTTTVAGRATPIIPTTGGQGRSDAGSSVPSSPSSLPASPAFSSAATPIVPTTGRLEGGGDNPGVAAGVAVGLVLAVVVVVVVVAVVLAAVFSVQRRRRKYDPTSNGTYEVALDTLCKFVVSVLCMHRPVTV